MLYNLLENKIWRKIRLFSKFSLFPSSVVRSWVLFEVQSFKVQSLEVGLSKFSRSKVSPSKLNFFEVGSFEVGSF
jgi:hypothetical protein